MEKAITRPLANPNRSPARSRAELRPRRFGYQHVVVSSGTRDFERPTMTPMLYSDWAARHDSFLRLRSLGRIMQCKKQTNDEQRDRAEKHGHADEPFLNDLAIGRSQRMFEGLLQRGPPHLYDFLA
jgi:hypothetical protein